jgi:hypothetical protein
LSIHKPEAKAKGISPLGLRFSFVGKKAFPYPKEPFLLGWGFFPFPYIVLCFSGQA